MFALGPGPSLKWPLGRLGPGVEAPAVPRSTAFDFVDGSANKLPAGVSYAARTGIVAYPIFRKVLRGFAANPAAIAGGNTGAPLHERGLPLFASVTNEAVNPRMVGGAISTYPVMTTGLAFTSATTQGGKNEVVIAFPSAHGLSNGSRWRATGAVSVGGITLNNSDAAAYNVEVLSPTTIQVLHQDTALTGASSGSGTSAYSNPGPDTLPDGMVKSGASSRFFRYVATAENLFAAGLGARRTLDIFGSGTADLLLQNVPGMPAGTALSYSGYMFGEPRAADHYSFANTTLEIVFKERDAGSNLLGTETAVNIDSQIGSSVYNEIRASFVAQNPACASVDVVIRASGAVTGDCRVQLFEYMLSRQIYPVLALPAVGAKASSTAGSSRIDDIVDDKTTRSFALEFDAHAIVNSDYDVLATNGAGLELRAAGAAFPRSLVLTDGTNTITLPNVLRADYQTQGFNRVVASFSGAGMVLAHNDFNTVASGSSAFNQSKASNRWRFNRDMSGAHEGFMWLRYVELSDRVHTKAQAEDLCRPTRNLSWAVPNIDFPVGRLGTYGNPAGAMPTSGTNQKLGVTAGVPTVYGNGSVTAYGPGSFLYTAASRLINAGASQPTAMEFVNMDLRGWYLSATTSTAMTGLTIRECLLDHSTVAGVTAIMTMRANWSNVLIEYCTIDLGSAPLAGIGQAIQSLGGSGFKVRRCKIIGVTADFINLLGGTVEECYFVARAGLINKHSDACQCNGGTSDDITIRRNFFDGRNPWGSRCDVNSAMITSSGNGNNKHAFLDEENLILGFTNPTQYRTRAASLHATGGKTVWSPRYAGGAMVQPLSLTVRNNRYEFATNSGNELDIKMGVSIRLVDPLGSPISLGKSGSSSTVMAKLGFEDVGPYPLAMPSTYIGGALTRSTTAGLATQVASVDPLLVTDMVASTTAKSHLANMNSATQYADPLANGDVLTINGFDFTFVSAAPAGDQQIGLGDTGDTIGAMLAKIQRVTGLACDLVPFIPLVTGNKTLLREKDLAVA